MEEQAKDSFSQPFQKESEDETVHREIELLNRASEKAVEAVKKRLTERRPKRPLPTIDYDK